MVHKEAGKNRKSRMEKALLIGFLAVLVISGAFLMRHRQTTQQGNLGWSMIDSLERGKVTSTANQSVIIPLAHLAINDDSFLAANKGGMKKKVTIADEQRSVVFAPSNTSLQFDLCVPPCAVLQFGYAVAPDAWDKAGDGSLFEVGLESDGSSAVLHSHYINPKGREEDRRWFDARVDLSEYASKDVQLTFTTRGTYDIQPPFERAPDERFDYALWSDPQIFTDDEWLRQTNVVLISIDTLRADHVSCLGYDRETTPSLDGLASYSVVFENAITPAPWTLPAHASLFTGLLPSQHGVQNFHQTLSAEAVTLAELLRADSFHTEGVASFEYLFPNYGLVQGFDDYFYRYPLSADKIVDRAIHSLDAHHGKRFFLFLHFFDPHDPYNPPAPYDEMFAPGEEKEQVGNQHKNPIKAFVGTRRQPTATDIESIIGLYDGEIRFVDDQLSRLFDRIKELGIWDNTIVVVASDHGEEFYEHGSFGHGFKLFEEQIRVPLIVKLPNSRLAGFRISDQVSLVDVFPTVLDELGIRAENRGPGHPLFASDRQIAQPQEYRVSETVAHGIKRMCLRSELLKYISPNVYNFKGMSYQKPEQLFDLRNDPRETENLAELEPMLVDSLREAAFEGIFGLSEPGWRFVMVTPKARSKFAGRIRSEGRFKDVYSLRCGDETVKQQDHALLFVKDVRTYFTSLSFELEPADAAIEVELQLNDSSDCLENVFLAPDGANPLDNPFGLLATEATIGIERLVRLATQPIGQETVLIFKGSDEREGHFSRSAGRAEIDARRKEALRALGYMR